ncbi:MAG: hypothetical protein IJU87_06865 [Lachnospiraceae bacterium]|nr:hypothetical protein [Lachnospiraceae bacterium]
MFIFQKYGIFKGMRFIRELYISRSLEGKEKKIIAKLKLGIGIVGVYCIAVPLYGSDPLEIYNAAELKQRWYRRSPLLIVGLAGGKKEAEYLSANILSGIYERQGDYDSRRFFNIGEELPERSSAALS